MWSVLKGFADDLALGSRSFGAHGPRGGIEAIALFIEIAARSTGLLGTSIEVLRKSKLLVRGGILSEDEQARLRRVGWNASVSQIEELLGVYVGFSGPVVTRSFAKAEAKLMERLPVRKGPPLARQTRIIVDNVWFRTLPTYVESIYEAPDETVQRFDEVSRGFVGYKGQHKDLQMQFAKELHGFPQSIVDLRLRGHAARARQAIALGDLVEDLVRDSLSCKWRTGLWQLSPAHQMFASIRIIERRTLLSWQVLRARVRRLGARGLRWADLEAGLARAAPPRWTRALLAGTDGSAPNSRLHPPFGNNRSAAWSWTLRYLGYQVIAEGGGRLILVPGPNFSGAVSASIPSAEAYAAIRLLSFLVSHARALQAKLGTRHVIIVFDNGIGWLTAAGDWLFKSEPGLTLQLIQLWEAALDAGWLLHLVWQKSHADKVSDESTQYPRRIDKRADFIAKAARLGSQDIGEGYGHLPIAPLDPHSRRRPDYALMPREEAPPSLDTLLTPNLPIPEFFDPGGEGGPDAPGEDESAGAAEELAPWDAQLDLDAGVGLAARLDRAGRAQSFLLLLLRGQIWNSGLPLE